MASLYDAIRKPWAAWEMTMEGHDPANFRCLDFSGNGRHLTLGDGGTAATLPEKLVQQRGYRKSVATQYFRGAALTNWASESITIETLIATRPSTYGSPYIISLQDAGNTSFIQLLISAGFYFYTGSTAASYRTTLLKGGQGAVTHLVSRRNGATGLNHNFVNGQQYGTQAGVPTSPVASAALGILLLESYTGGSDLLCDIYLCRIWDVALTDIQIQELNRRAKRELHRI